MMPSAAGSSEAAFGAAVETRSPASAKPDRRAKGLSSEVRTVGNSRRFAPVHVASCTGPLHGLWRVGWPKSKQKIYERIHAPAAENGCSS